MDNDGKPMNEFEWEEFMKRSDEHAAKYAALLEKYHDHPDRDAIIDKEMGWNIDDGIDRPWIKELNDAIEEMMDEEQSEEWKKDAGISEPSGVEEMEKDPLYAMGLAFAVDSIRWCEGLPEEVKEDADMTEAMQHLLIPAAKIAGATVLPGEEEDKEMLGLRIANYKRALASANSALQYLSAVREKGLIPSDQIFPYIKRATELRNAIALRIQEVRDRFNMPE